jgi:hypothetical protein
VAGKEPVVELAETVTEAGTPSAPLLLESETEAPPTGAAWLSVTVHCDTPEVLNEVGLQINPLSDTPAATLMLPPVPVVVIALPSRVAPRVFVIPIEVEATLAPIVTLITATTPLEMVLESIP